MRADSSLFLPYFFRTTPPSLDSLRSKYHSHLIALEGQTGLLAGMLLDPAAMILRTDPCASRPVEYLSDPLPALGYLLSGISRGISLRADYGNTVSDDNAFIFAASKFVPLTVELPQKLETIMGGRKLTREQRFQWEQIENFGFRSTLDIDRIRSFAYSLSVTGAHELGHLLGLDHVPEHLLPGILPTLMSGHGHSFDPTSKLAMGTQWTTQEHAYLLLLFGDH